jgi:hypothetical protein
MTKNYLKGSAQAKVFDDGGSVINISILESDFDSIPRKKSKSGVVYRVFSVSSRRETDQYGNSHSVYIQDQEDKGYTTKKPSTPVSNTKAKVVATQEEDDLPF